MDPFLCVSVRVFQLKRSYSVCICASTMCLAYSLPFNDAQKGMQDANS